MSFETAQKIIKELPYSSNVTLARKYGVTTNAISHIRNGRSWEHIPRPPGITAGHRTKITDAVINEIKELKAAGCSSIEIQQRLNISQPTIRKYS